MLRPPKIDGAWLLLGTRPNSGADEPAGMRVPVLRSCPVPPQGLIGWLADWLHEVLVMGFHNRRHQHHRHHRNLAILSAHPIPTVDMLAGPLPGTAAY